MSSILLILGAVFACSAPFIHVFFTNSQNIELIKVKKEYKERKFNRKEYLKRKREVTFFGYTNQRKLWYAIGKPIAMLYFSIILLYATTFINEKKIKSAFTKISAMGILVSFYFIVWAFWYRADFPEYLYYIMIGLVSVLLTLISYNMVESRNNIIYKIRLLTNHIVFKGKKHVPNENKAGYISDYLETFKKLID